MTWLETPHDMRHSMRARAHGTVLLCAGARLIHGRIHDFGTGGVALQADLALGLASLAGRRAHLELRLDGEASKWFALDGHVLRASVATRIVVVGFDRVPSDYEDCVHDQLLDAIEHHRLPSMVVVDEALRRGPPSPPAQKQRAERWERQRNR